MIWSTRTAKPKRKTAEISSARTPKSEFPLGLKKADTHFEAENRPKEKLTPVREPITLKKERVTIAQLFLALSDPRSAHSMRRARPALERAKDSEKRNESLGRRGSDVPSVTEARRRTSR